MKIGRYLRQHQLHAAASWTSHRRSVDEREPQQLSLAPCAAEEHVRVGLELRDTPARCHARVGTRYDFDVRNREVIGRLLAGASQRHALVERDGLGLDRRHDELRDVSIDKQIDYTYYHIS